MKGDTAGNLIGFGADLQQKLDAMDRKSRRARWAGYVGEELFEIARRLHECNLSGRSGRQMRNRTERELIEQAESAVLKLGLGIKVLRQPNPIGWPLYIVFPGDLKSGLGIDAYYEKGIAVPPRF